MNLQTNFIVDLSGLQTEQRRDTLQGNIGKSFYFRSKDVSQANSSEESDVLLLTLALGLVEFVSILLW